MGLVVCNLDRCISSGRVIRSVAIERRWIPAHERALAALELELEEVEREDSARVRRITGSEV